MSAGAVVEIEARPTSEMELVVAAQRAAEPVEPRGHDRVLELDSLRGLAALMVALYHYTQRYDELYKHAPGLIASMPWGRYGVQLFFIISGFVILMSVQRAKTAPDFAVQRAARLYPAFWVACIATWLIVYFVGLPGREVSIQRAALNLTMAPLWFKWVDPGVWYVDGAYWSLKEELVFYIVIGLTLLTRMRRHALWVVAGCMAVHLVGCLVYHRLNVDGAEWFGKQMGFSGKGELASSFTLKWFNLFALGMVIYECRTGFRPRHAVVLTLIFFDLLPQSYWRRQPSVEGWEHFVFVCAAAFAVFIATHYRPRVLRIAPLLFLGTISYSFYLLHQNIGYIVIRGVEANAPGLGPNVAVLVALVVITILATGLTYGVEKPAYRVVKGFIARRAARRQLVTVGAVPGRG